VTYIDPVTGKRRDLQRRAESKADARDLVHELLNEIDSTDGRTLAHERKTFVHLAALDAARAYFGHRMLRSITYADLASFRASRLKTPTRGDLARHSEALKRYEKALKHRKRIQLPKLRASRSIATVNRELALLRRIFNVAQREGSRANATDAPVAVAGKPGPPPGVTAEVVEEPFGLPLANELLTGTPVRTSGFRKCEPTPVEPPCVTWRTLG
jgi:hypothetical protein